MNKKWNGKDLSDCIYESQAVKKTSQYDTLMYLLKPILEVSDHLFSIIPY